MNRLNVFCLGDRVGTLAEARGGIVFEYAPEFLAFRHELSPLALLSDRVLDREISPFWPIAWPIRGLAPRFLGHSSDE